jgi:hypothetical protein
MTCELEPNQVVSVDTSKNPGDIGVNVVVRDLSLPWPERGQRKTSDEYIIETLKEFLEVEYQNDTDEMRDDIDYVTEMIFKTCIGLKEGDPFKGHQKTICLGCWSYLKNMVDSLMENNMDITTDTIKDFRKIITSIATDVLNKNEEPPGRRDSVNILLFVNALDQDKVLRATPQGTIFIPNRFDDPLNFTDTDIDDCGLRPVMDLITNARNKDLLEKLFAEKLSERFKKIAWSDEKIKAYKDTLIKILINDLSFDIVRDTALIANDQIMAHPRRGKKSGNGPSIWIGEYTMRTLAHFGDDGVIFLAEPMLEKGQHFMTKSDNPKHGELISYPDGSTNEDDLVEHSDDFTNRFYILIMQIEAAIDEYRNGGTLSRKISERIHEKRIKRNFVGQGKWKRGKDKLKSLLEEVFENYVGDTSFDALADYSVDEIATKILQIMYEIDTINVDHHYIYTNYLKETIIAFMKDTIQKRKLSHESIAVFREAMGNKIEDFSLKYLDNREGSEMLLHNYIDKEMVVRIRKDGRVFIPSRLEPPLELTLEQIDRFNFRPYVDFIQQKLNRNLLEKVFEDRLAQCFRDIKWFEGKIDKFRNDMIEKLLEKGLSIDLVLGCASICRGIRTAHCRRGTLKSRGPGIWMGELSLLELMRDKTHPKLANKGRTNKEFFAEILLEEAQHFFGKGRPHKPLKYNPATGKDNYDEVIWHDEQFEFAFGNMIKSVLSVMKKEKIAGPGPDLLETDSSINSNGPSSSMLF